MDMSKYFTNTLKVKVSFCGEDKSKSNTDPLPYITPYGSLVIPFNSGKKYHYWNGGQGVCETLKELGRCDLIPKYKSVYSN